MNNRLLKFTGLTVLTGILMLNTSSVRAVVEEPTDTPNVTEEQTTTPSATPRATRRVTTTPRPTKDTSEFEAKLEQAKERTLAVFTDKVEPRLAELEERIRNNENLNSDAKGKIVARINSEQAWIKAQSEKVTNEDTLVGVRELAVEAKNHFEAFAKEVKLMHMRYGFVVNLENVVTKTEDVVIPKVSSAIERFDELGLDTTVARSLLEAVIQSVTDAKAELVELRNSSDYETAKDHFDAAKADLLEARESLKGILESLRAQAEELKEEAAIPTEEVATPSVEVTEEI